MSSNPSPNTYPDQPPKSRLVRFPRPGRRKPAQSTLDYDARMSLIEHLRELRDRLVKSVLGVVVATALAFTFINQLMDIFLARRPAGVTLQVIQPPEIFGSYFRVALTFGIALSMPIIVYQIVRFLSPGLMPNERRWLVLGLPIVTAFFLSGAVFCYFVLLPPAVNFLYSFGDPQIQRNWRLSDYINFVTNFVLAAGLAFQLPPVLFLLAKLRIVTPRVLGRFRRYAIVLAAVAAAVITPTTDPFNMMLLAVPIYLLYELGVIMARLA